MDKYHRFETIKTILKARAVYSQEELQEILADDGILVTQATLSRDLKGLHVSKVQGEGGRRKYVLGEFDTGIKDIVDLPDHLDGVKSIEFSGQLGVVKTIPGFANAVAYYIDQANIHEIMGTIAGDDTILLIARSNISGNQLAGSISSRFKNLINKFI